MNDIRIFDNEEFGSVRTVIIDGEPWFVGNDIAGILKYKDKYSAIKKNVDEEDRRVCPVGSASGVQDTTVINESGLYSLIFGSKLESAKKFKKWVTSEVLPQIRKNGTFQIESLQDDPMKLLELHYEAIKITDKKADEANEKAEMANEKAEALEQRFNKFEADIPIFNIDAKNIQKEVRKKAIEMLGGKDSRAYKDNSIRGSVFGDIQVMLRRNFGVRRYEEIKHQRVDDAIQLISEYQLPLILKERVEDANG